MFKSSKGSKKDSKYIWTHHVFKKMKFYGLSENRIKRIIKFPKRIEEAIVPGMVAVMQPAGTKKYSEIWAMYKIISQTTPDKKITNKKIKIITAWRYPGKSPARQPIPPEIMREIQSLL